MWFSENTNIATVTSGNTGAGYTYGDSPGSTAIDFMVSGTMPPPTCNLEESCDEDDQSADAGGTVSPHIDSISPTAALVGSTGIQITINGTGFGNSPTVNLPSGFSNQGQAATDTRIVVTVNISLNATIGSVNLSVTSNGQTSNQAAFTADGPAEMKVISDSLGLCAGCSTTVQRSVNYQVLTLSGSLPGTITIGESPSFSSWSCTQAEGHSITSCSAPTNTNSDSTFTDLWSMSSDAYTPGGCGFNITDHWQWCATSTPVTFGTLTGYIHTNAININGCVSPGCTLSSGTVIRP